MRKASPSRREVEGRTSPAAAVPVQGGIVLCTTRMSRILKLEKESLTATVETGLGLRAAGDAVERGPFFPARSRFLGATIGKEVVRRGRISRRPGLS